MGTNWPRLPRLLLLVPTTLVITCQVVTAVEIRRLTVPRWVQNGTEIPVVLDCDYVYNENDLRLVVKWFLNEELEPVYQWIPELNVRHTAGLLKDRLDLEFSAKPRDPYSRYRALRIRQPTPDLSGTYTCLVTSLAGQDMRQQHMLVYVPAKNFNFSYTENLHGDANFSCEAEGVNPRPHMVLNRINIETSSYAELPGSRTNLIPHKDTYDISIWRNFRYSDFPRGSAQTLECVVEIPGTNYREQRRLVYYPGLSSAVEEPGHITNSAVSVVCFTVAWSLVGICVLLHS